MLRWGSSSPGSAVGSFPLAEPGRSFPPTLSLPVEHEMLPVRLAAAARLQRPPRGERPVLRRALALVAVPER